MQSTFQFLPHAIEWVWHGYKVEVRSHQHGRIKADTPKQDGEFIDFLPKPKVQ